MDTTVSIHWNEGAISRKHNDRDEDLCSHESHIDFYNEHGKSEHEAWLKSVDMKLAYEKIFGEALAEYNAKQKRKDRKMTIEEYMQSVEDDNRGRKRTTIKNGKRVIDENPEIQGKRLSYEITVKVGNTDRLTDDDGRVIYDSNGHHIRINELPREITKKAMQRYLYTFENENPNFVVIGCNWHADEGFYNKRDVWEYSIDHMHLEFVPIAHNYTRGLSVQNSIGKALNEMGFESSPSVYNEWATKEQERLEQIVIEEYEKYCAQNVSYAQEHGDLNILHPVRDKTKMGDMTKEQYGIEQEQNEREAEQRVKGRELFIRRGELEEEYEDKEDALKAEYERFKDEYKAECDKALAEAIEAEKKSIHDYYDKLLNPLIGKLKSYLPYFEKLKNNKIVVNAKTDMNAVEKIMQNDFQPGDERVGKHRHI